MSPNSERNRAPGRACGPGEEPDARRRPCTSEHKRAFPSEMEVVEKTRRRKGYPQKTGHAFS